MSYDTVRYYYENLSGRSLSIIECGLQICHSGHTSGKLVCPDYSAHFILEGKGKYTVNDRTYELRPGLGFMIMPNIPTLYVADDREPWRYIYATFKGPDAKSLISSCGLSDHDVIFNFPTDDETVNLIKKLHRVGKDNGAKGYDALGYFLIIMSNLVREYNKSRSQQLSPTHYIRLALSYIDDHLSYNINVRDVAAYIGIDRTHLYRLFTEQVGVSPSKYITNERLKRAVSLMAHKQLSINEIAISAGFYDLSHFTKAFTEKYGTTPGKYRKINILSAD